MLDNGDGKVRTRIAQSGPYGVSVVVTQGVRVTPAGHGNSTDGVDFLFARIVCYVHKQVHVQPKGFIMEAISYTSVRATLAKTMKKVCENHDPVIINRKNSESVVMLSLSDFDSLQETSYLMRSPKNACRLFESIEELNEGRGRERELAE